MIQLDKDLDPERINEIRSCLHSAGLKSTISRILVYNTLLDSKEPITRVEISAKLNILGFDNSTIYRNLSDLCKANLVSKYDHQTGDLYKFLIVSPDK